MSTQTRVRCTELRAAANGAFRVTRNHYPPSYARICTLSALHSPRIERSRTADRPARPLVGVDRIELAFAAQAIVGQG